MSGVSTSSATLSLPAGAESARALGASYKVIAPMLALNLVGVALNPPTSMVRWLVNLAFAVALAASFLTHRRGRSRLAAAILASGFWVAAATSVYLLGGTRSPGLFVFVPVVATASLCWSLRAGAVLTGASVLAVMSAAQLDAWGFLPKAAPVSAPRLWIVFTGCLLVTAVVVAASLEDRSRFRRELRRTRQRFEQLEQQSSLENKRNEERLEREREHYERRLQTLERMHAMGRLAGSVAHDFNNLITVILNSSALLERRISKDEHTRFLLGEINDAASRSAAMARKLLALGRQQPGQPEYVSLSLVVDEMQHLLRRLCGPPIRLELRLSKGDDLVFADRLQLEQMLLNLTVNARDAMPDGGLLCISVERASGEAPDRERVILIVEDRGLGMDESTLQQIFDPFFTTKSESGGTGLGLCAVQSAVDACGGSVKVKSTPQTGTRFEVALPKAFDGAMTHKAEAG